VISSEIPSPPTNHPWSGHLKNNRPADASVIKCLPHDATPEQAATLTPARIAAERQNRAAAEETD
jgi:hypothetical protein